MKKILFLVLMCFAVLFASFAMDMSPQPGDMLETVLTVQDNVVMSQAENVPAINVLHFESIYNYDEICLSANEEIPGYHYLNSSGLTADMAVLDNGYELGTIYNITGEITAIYKTEFG